MGGTFPVTAQHASDEGRGRGQTTGAPAAWLPVAGGVPADALGVPLRFSSPRYLCGKRRRLIAGAALGDQERYRLLTFQRLQGVAGRRDRVPVAGCGTELAAAWPFAAAAAGALAAGAAALVAEELELLPVWLSRYPKPTSSRHAAAETAAMAGRKPLACAMSVDRDGGTGSRQDRRDHAVRPRAAAGLAAWRVAASAARAAIIWPLDGIGHGRGGYRGQDRAHRGEVVGDRRAAGAAGDVCRQLACRGNRRRPRPGTGRVPPRQDAAACSFASSLLR